MRIICDHNYYMLQDFSELSFDERANVLLSFINDDEQLLFHEYKYNFLNIQSSVDDERVPFYEFMLKRAKYTNDKWLFDWPCPFIGLPGNALEAIWYEPLDKQELIYTMKNQYLFNCIITKKDKAFEEISYTIYHSENNSEDINGIVLDVYEKREGDFENNVIPKLKSLIENITFV